MFTSASFFEFIIGKLRNDYYLIVPTYSGHYENSIYLSMEDEEMYIDTFLQENNIGKLKAVIGFSLGGNMAFHYFYRNQDKIDKVIVDSAPLFKFPGFIKRYFYGKYKRCLENIKENPVNAIKELDKHFHGMGSCQQYVAPIITMKSLKNLIESCYSVDLPKLNTISEKKITFVYGTNDIARLCLPRIKKYRNSKIEIIKSFNHCQYFRTNADEYLSKLVL